MVTYVIGILALGLVVLVHEFGHFLAARLCGVTVTAFSIGWGPVLLRKKVGETEYRLSALPLGGYCGMKGEHAFREALDTGADHIERERGSFYAAHPLKRIIIALSGPLANLLFAVAAYTLVAASGYSYATWENRIVPAWQFDGQGGSPAELAGLEAGDRILSVNGVETPTYSDIQQSISIHPEETLSLRILRKGQAETVSIKPDLDKKTGSGKIGIYPYIPLIVGSVKGGSAAQTADLREGDRITAVNGVPVEHFLEFDRALASRPEEIEVTVQRGSFSLTKDLVVVYGANGSETGIGWEQVQVRHPGEGLLSSVKTGISETGRTIGLTVKGISLLFRGVDVTEAVSGPVRITYMLGEVAQGGLTGLSQLLGIICVSLFLMNLLPIPVLDGGLILLNLLEALRNRPLRPKTLYYAQFIGMAFILCVFALALFSDLHFLAQ